MEPDNGRNSGQFPHAQENCAVLNPTFDWSDVNCLMHNKFICKFILQEDQAKTSTGSDKNSNLDGGEMRKDVNNLVTSVMSVLQEKQLEINKTIEKIENKFTSPKLKYQNKDKKRNDTQIQV